MNSTETLQLLLNTVFYDAPKRILEILDLYETADQFKAESSAYIDGLSSSATSKDWMKKRIAEFNPDSYLDALEKKGMSLLFESSSLYPPLLKEIFDWPPVLYYKGNPAFLSEKCFAIVGTRECSQYGLEATRALTKALLPYFVITSGLASGVDTAAHFTALDEGYPTIAVVGTGLDLIFPPENRGLFERIARDGIVISEYPPGVYTAAHRFPQRNRIISGLCQGVLVTEAPEKSGALITARTAMEQGREVFAIPGSIFSKKSDGPHRLIQDGVKLVTNVEDILNEYQVLIKVTASPRTSARASLLQEKLKDLSAEETKLITLLSNSALSTDELIEKSELTVHQTLQSLSYLEMKDILREENGKWEILT